MATWVLALYEKRGRAYREIGVFFEEETDAEDAYSAFASIVDSLPTWQAVDAAINFCAENPEEAIPEYEIRLINNDTHRVLSTLLWDSETMREVVDNTPPKKPYKATVNLLLFPHEIEEYEESQELDWESLSETDRIEISNLEPEGGTDDDGNL